MATFVRFPKVGANIEEGMVGPWYHEEGESVIPSDTLCELITDKATFDLPAEAEGVLYRILAPEKSTVPVNTILAVVGEDAGAVTEAEAENARLMEAYRARAAAGWDSSAAAAPAAGKKRARAKPAARRLAKELGVELDDVAAVSDGPVVTEDDVRRFAEEKSHDA